MSASEWQKLGALCSTIFVLTPRSIHRGSDASVISVGCFRHILFCRKPRFALEGLLVVGARRDCSVFGICVRVKRSNEPDLRSLTEFQILASKLIFELN